MISRMWCKWGAIGVGLIVGACAAEMIPPATDNWTREDGGSGTDEGGDTPGPDDGISETCVPTHEECNGLDDDCDTTVDDGFDFLTDIENCGECGISCSALPNADGVCSEGACVITACHAGWVDANRGAADGCEYECTPSLSSESPDDGSCMDEGDNDCDNRIDSEDPDCEECVPEFCDAADNDCDGLTDEDFDVDFDAYNCGGCGLICPLRSNAISICVLGECDIRCHPGSTDANGRIFDGCEATCTPTGATNEAECDGVDDDCDGVTDEEYVGDPCGAGLCVRRPVCHRGTEICRPRMAPAVTDSTCDGLDEDCDGATDEEWIPTDCIGMCADTATCIDGVGTCGTPAPTDHTCDNVDDDCDGATDEEYARRICGVGICARESMCAMGIERCVEGPSRPETCNNLDDDCDGTTDNDPPPPATLCPPVPRGTAGCVGGACSITGCDTGWADADGVGSNGCECELEPTEGTGTSCTNAINLDAIVGGPFIDNRGTDYTIRGKIAPAGDEDWYRFTGVDSPDTTCDALNVDIRFTSNPGSAFRMDVFRNTADCSSTTCADIADGYSFYTDYLIGSGPTARGECQCRTSNTEGFNICRDQTATYIFRVYRAPGSPGNCSEYAIRVTNGVF